MRVSPLFFVCAAGIATLGAGQAVLPTARAQAGAAPAVPSDYQVSVQSLETKHTLHGLEVAGQIVNTGKEALTYTSVVLVFTHAAGPDTRENAYLTTGPVRPGESAEFRAALPEPLPFKRLSLILREAGQPVTVTTAATKTATRKISDAQNPDRRLTAVR